MEWPYQEQRRKPGAINLGNEDRITSLVELNVRALNYAIPNK